MSKPKVSKPKVAFYWCASCGGCEEAVVDLAEDILTVADAVDIVFWPVALDFKKKDIEAMQDASIAVSFINGAIRTSEQEEMVNLLRKKSGLVVAFGSCAHLGGIPGLANFSDKAGIFERAYKLAPTVTNPDGIYPQTETQVPEGSLTLPVFYDTVKTVDQTIDVDYYLPGCAPPPDLILNAVTGILEGKLPGKGAVLAPDKSLCDTCPLAEYKPEKISIKDIKRPHEVVHDPEQCFLAEGIICLGPATRSGCGERCIKAGMPCRGCFGPTRDVKDMGTKVLTSIASLIGIETEEEMSEEELQKVLAKIVDPGGLFFMYSLPSSVLRRRRIK
ncbi:oxidoreductase [candidate division WOR-3 bacterium]|nr:oxidoreductase [candidate division WOR-3 bacterium]